jgi:predicted GH43/DUF377 family glycosyl hydrolase
MSIARRWRKLGLVFCPDGSVPWMRTHAAVPTAEHIGGDQYRIYFSSRDITNKSFTGFVVVDITKPNVILQTSEEPVLSPGALGEFDDSGAMVTWIAKHGDVRYLYYIGWNLGVTVPFRNSIGLSTSGQNGPFKRYAPGPILDRSTTEPHFCASCCVIPTVDIWHMWYLSCVGWEMRDGKVEHKYHIKYASSKDGIHWDRTGQVAIDFLNSEEYAISRPTVMLDNDVWKMWFSCRGDTYRIGYAESTDGQAWTRMDDKAGIDVSDTGWDSEMIEYPFVFDHDGKRYMLYNGNNYGKTGFGLAVLE